MTECGDIADHDAVSRSGGSTVPAEYFMDHIAAHAGEIPAPGGVPGGNPAAAQPAGRFAFSEPFPTLDEVESFLIDEALAREEVTAYESAQGLDAVMGLVRRRFGKQFIEDPQSAERRLAGYLGRRGYDWDTIHAITRVLREEAGGHDGVPSS